MADEMRIGVLTSGGDCSGLNAVIRAVVRRAVGHYGWQVYGILDGTLGLIRQPREFMELDLRLLRQDILRQGGTLLGTVNRGNPEDAAAHFSEGVRELGLQAMIVIGGDGSIRIIRELCREARLPMVAVPKTIDNDVAATEYSVGFSTAANVVTEALDRLQPTAASHHRVMILEVMGRDVGHIALNAGIAGGADVILVPEIPYTMAGIAGALRRVEQEEGRRHALIVVAEGVRTEDGQSAVKTHSGGEVRYGGIGNYLSQKISEMTGAETRVTILGHTQRGGVPSMPDRLIGSAFGVQAVDLLAAGRHDMMVAWQDRGVVAVPLDQVAGVTRALDPAGALVRAARGLGIYVGDEAPDA